MARPRSKNSKNSFKGLGLTPEEEQKLKLLLSPQQKDLSANQLMRKLVRDWMSQQTLKPYATSK